MGCHFLLQGIFPTQGLNPGLLHCRQILYQRSYEGSPYSLWMVFEYVSKAPLQLEKYVGFLLSVSSVAQSCLTLRPHGLQHDRLPCPSSTPGACSNSCYRGGDAYQFHPYLSVTIQSPLQPQRKGTSSPPAIFPLTHREKRNHEKLKQNLILKFMSKKNK